jgi:hypothetical protein
MSDNAPSLTYMTQTKYWGCNGHFIDVQTSHFTRQKILKKKSMKFPLTVISLSLFDIKASYFTPRRFRAC